MLRVAVTGGIACGKSLVGEFLSSEGIPVCEADELARDQMRPGRPVYHRVVQAFGAGILAGDGTIDRPRLARRVFSRPGERARLNALVHPAVFRELRKWLAGRGGNCRAAAVIVPLLYEVGEGGGWDAVVCVTASDPVRIRRMRDRGWSEPEARQRMRAQMDVERKAERADYVMVNNGTEELLREQLRRVLGLILER